jgi:hypothetical protein
LTGALSKHDFSEIPGLNTSLQKFAQNSFLNENSRNRLCEGVVSITGLHNSCNLKLQIFYPWLHDQHVPLARWKTDSEMDQMARIEERKGGLRCFLP